MGLVNGALYIATKDNKNMIDYKLVDARNWTKLLEDLEPGTSTIRFHDIQAIKSCKAVAYDLNSDKKGRTYTFKVDKETCSAEITVKVNNR